MKKLNITILLSLFSFFLLGQIQQNKWKALGPMSKTNMVSWLETLAVDENSWDQTDAESHSSESFKFFHKTAYSL